jgi:hypothetical protein
MSIAKRQISAVIDKVIKEFLQNGIAPSLRAITRRVGEILNGRVLGQPTFVLRPAPYRETSSSEDHNAMMEEIYTDLKVAFDENIDQSNRVLVNFEFFETEKRKREKRMNAIEDRINELLLLNSNSDGYLYSVSDTFTDQTKIDLTQSNMTYNPRLQEITPKMVKNGTRKVDLSSISPKTELVGVDKSEVISETTVQQITNMFDDSINSAWEQELVLSSSKSMSYRITLANGTNLLAPDKVTRLTLNPHVANPVEVDIRISEDGYNWILLDKIITDEEMVWDFPKINLKGIEILLSKQYPDQTRATSSGQTGYVYYFGIKNISLLCIGFEDYGELISLPLDLTDRQGNPVPINKLSLEVEEETPISTDIKYFIAWDEAVPQWQSISQITDPQPDYPKIIDMQIVSSTIPVQNIISPSSMFFTNANGLDFYSLIDDASISTDSATYGVRKLITDPRANAIKLYKGINQWYLERYEHKIDISRPPKMDDWLTLPVSYDLINRGYKPIEDIITLNDNIYTNYRLTTNIYMDTDSPVTFSFSVPDNIPAIYATLFINNMDASGGGFKVQKVSDGIRTVTAQFVKGWNSIELLIYKDTEVAVPMNLGFNLRDKSSTIRSHVAPMTMVSEFDLLYNVAEKDIEKFSITEDNKLIIGKYLNDLGATYEFYYKYYLDDSVSKKILFKAQFVKENGSDNPPPKLKSYKIRAS